MGYLLQLYTDNVPSDVTASLLAIEAPEVAIESLWEWNRKHGHFVGEFDHLRYEEEALPELYAAQWETFENQLSLPFYCDSGIPAVNHVPLASVVELANKLREASITLRPAYAQGPAEQLLSWLDSTAAAGRGLLVFYG